MRNTFYILLISLVFLCVASWFTQSWVEALPMALIGACMGWALKDFKQETHKEAKKKTH